MTRPRQAPIGLVLAATAKRVSRAFDGALAEAGGSRPAWLILLALKVHAPETQQALAEEVGIRGATLTQQLEGMERDGLVARERVPGDRRTQRVTLTAEGERAFERLRGAAMGFDARLRAGLKKSELEVLRRGLAQLEENVAG